VSRARGGRRAVPLCPRAGGYRPSGHRSRPAHALRRPATGKAKSIPSPSGRPGQSGPYSGLLRSSRFGAVSEGVDKMSAEINGPATATDRDGAQVPRTRRSPQRCWASAQARRPRSARSQTIALTPSSRPCHASRHSGCSESQTHRGLPGDRGCVLRREGALRGPRHPLLGAEQSCPSHRGGGQPCFALARDQGAQGAAGARCESRPRTDGTVVRGALPRARTENATRGRARGRVCSRKLVPSCRTTAGRLGLRSAFIGCGAVHGSAGPDVAVAHRMGTMRRKWSMNPYYRGTSCAYPAYRSSMCRT